MTPFIWEEGLNEPALAAVRKLADADHHARLRHRDDTGLSGPGDDRLGVRDLVDRNLAVGVDQPETRASAPHERRLRARAVVERRMRREHDVADAEPAQPVQVRA